MWVMISGPYGTGARSEAERAENLKALNRVALEVFRRGHVPIVGVNLALPIVEVAGPAVYDEIMLPMSLAAAERCDAVLRVGGRSAGADAEVDILARRGCPVFRTLEEIPVAER
jgi:hypothetical protein